MSQIALECRRQPHRALETRPVENTQTLGAQASSRRPGHQYRGVRFTFYSLLLLQYRSADSISPWEAGRAAAWRRDRAQCADPDAQLRCCLVAEDYSSNLTLAKRPLER